MDAAIKLQKGQAEGVVRVAAVICAFTLVSTCKRRWAGEQFLYISCLD